LFLDKAKRFFSLHDIRIVSGRRGCHILSNGHRGLFPLGQSSRDVKLLTNLHQLPKLWICGAILPFPLYVFMAQCWINLALIQFDCYCSEYTMIREAWKSVCTNTGYKIHKINT
jgi:hypothetical protein